MLPARGVTSVAAAAPAKEGDVEEDTAAYVNAVMWVNVVIDEIPLPTVTLILTWHGGVITKSRLATG